MSFVILHEDCRIFSKITMQYLENIAGNIADSLFLNYYNYYLQWPIFMKKITFDNFELDLFFVLNFRKVPILTITLPLKNHLLLPTILVMSRNISLSKTDAIVSTYICKTEGNISWVMLIYFWAIFVEITYSNPSVKLVL